MHNTPQPLHQRIPIGVYVTAGVVTLSVIGGILVWLTWQWSTGMFYLLYGAVALTAAAGVARVWAHVLVFLRKHTPARLDTLDNERITRANRSQGLPDGITTLNYHDSHKALPLPEPIIDVTPLSRLPIPSFSSLLDQGLIGPGRPLILGYDAATGHALTGSWKDLYSCGVGAQQGAGKTWLLVFLLAQSAAAGGKLIVCDLHAGDAESLASRLAGLERSFMRDVADTPKAILSAFEYANAKLEARKHNTARLPLILVCDEWTSLLRTSAGEKLEPLVQNIAEQGRKFNVNAILSAQAWTKDASSAVRNQLTSHYVLRQRPDEARYQLGMRAAQLPGDIRELPDATGYFLNVKGEMIKVIIPRMTADDITRVALLIDRPANATGVPFGLVPAERVAITAEINGKSTGNQNPQLISTAPQSRKPISPEAERATRAFLEGKDIPEIIREIKGDLKGRAYQAASAEIHALIREGMQS